jgi:cobalt-zinc-cadmium efflux system outer membrane protein
MIAALGCAGEQPTLWPDSIRHETSNAPPVANPASPSVPALFVPPGVELADGITSDEAVALALWNNASFKEALAALGLSRAAIAQAGMLSNPTLSVLFPVSVKQLEFAVAVPIDVLWLRPTRMALAEVEAQRTAARLVQGGLDLARDVRVAAVDLEQTRAQLRIVADSRALRTEISAIAERRLELGDASELETGTARVDAIEAEQQLTRARIAASEAEQRFFSLLGLWPGGATPAYVPAPPTDDCGGDLDALWQQALRARPDFRAAALGVSVADARGDLAIAEMFGLSAIYDANGKGTLGFESGPGFSAVLPLLNQNQGGRARADADGDVALAAWVALLQHARLELALALVRERQTAVALRSSRAEITPRLQARLAQSQQSYALGEVAYVAVLETQRALLDAQLREVDLAAEYDRACVEIVRSLGTRVAPLPDTTAATAGGGIH